MDDDEILAQAGQIEAERMLAAAVATPEDPVPAAAESSGDPLRDAYSAAGAERDAQRAGLTERIFRR